VCIAKEAVEEKMKEMEEELKEMQANNIYIYIYIGGERDAGE
jgi:hypothetical protein